MPWKGPRNSLKPRHIKGFQRHRGSMKIKRSLVRTQKRSWLNGRRIKSKIYGSLLTLRKRAFRLTNSSRLWLNSWRTNASSARCPICKRMKLSECLSHGISLRRTHAPGFSSEKAWTSGFGRCKTKKSSRQWLMNSLRFHSSIRCRAKTNRASWWPPRHWDLKVHLPSASPSI